MLLPFRETNVWFTHIFTYYADDPYSGYAAKSASSPFVTLELYLVAYKAQPKEMAPG